MSDDNKHNNWKAQDKDSIILADIQHSVVGFDPTGAVHSPTDTYTPGQGPGVSAIPTGEVDKDEQLVYDESGLVKAFDHTEARWQDEKAYEDFEEYRTFMKKTCAFYGVEMISLESEPFVLKYKHLNTICEVQVTDEGRISVDKSKIEEK